MKNKLLNFSFLTLVYAGIFLVIYLLHINFFGVEVILYSAILDVVISIIIFFIFLGFYKDYFDFNSFELTLISIIFLTLGYSFAISVPTVIDRSLSFYILEKIQQHDGSIKTEVLRDIFINDYIDEYRLVEVRITEQIESGTIRIEDNCIHLTNKGYMTTKVSSFIRKRFVAKNRLLMNEYTDELTDPLSDSKQKREYMCKD